MLESNDFTVIMEWRGIIKEFLFYSESQNLSKNTIKTRKSLIIRFSVYCQANDCHDPLNVTRKLIRSFMRYERQSGMSASYVNQMLITVRAFYRFLVDEEYLDEDSNPTDKVKFMKKTKKVTETFSDEEMIQIINAAGNHKNKFMSSRNKLIVMMMADSGLRVNELVNLSVDDVSSDRILVRHGKGDRQRVVYVTNILAREVLKYQRFKKSYFKDRRMVDPEFFFVGFKGERLRNDGIQKMLRRIEPQIELRESIRFSPHTFRHYFASSQLRNGADILTVSRMLGHADLNTTQIYLSSIVNEELLESAKATSPLANLNKQK